jgi:hypothetical protein
MVAVGGTVVSLGLGVGLLTITAAIVAVGRDGIGVSERQATSITEMASMIARYDDLRIIVYSKS